MLTHTKTSFKQTQTLANLVVTACLLIPALLWSQLKVAPKTLLTVKSTLSSKEQNNTFESSVNGQGTFALTGDDQTLSVAPNKTLHTLHIFNATQTSIQTPLQLKGNLIVEKGTLTLTQPIQLAGQLILKNNAAIKGIWFLNPTNYKPNALTNNSTFKTLQQGAALMHNAHNVVVLNNLLKSNPQSASSAAIEPRAQTPSKPPPKGYMPYNS